MNDAIITSHHSPPSSSGTQNENFLLLLAFRLDTHTQTKVDEDRKSKRVKILFVVFVVFRLFSNIRFSFPSPEDHLAVLAGASPNESPLPWQ